MTPLFAEKRKCEVGMNNEKKRINEKLLWNIPTFITILSNLFQMLSFKSDSAWLNIQSHQTDLIAIN